MAGTRKKYSEEVKRWNAILDSEGLNMDAGQFGDSEGNAPSLHYGLHSLTTEGEWLALGATLTETEEMMQERPFGLTLRPNLKVTTFSMERESMDNRSRRVTEPDPFSLTGKRLGDYHLSREAFVPSEDGSWERSRTVGEWVIRSRTKKVGRPRKGKKVVSGADRTYTSKWRGKVRKEGGDCVATEAHRGKDLKDCTVECARIWSDRSAAAAKKVKVAESAGRGW